MAPVATLLASNAIARLPSASLSPMIPEPTTAATRKVVPRNSATIAARLLWRTTSSVRGYLLSNLYECWRVGAARAIGSSRVLKNYEHFPFITIGITDPRFVLQRITAVRLHFIASLQARFSPPVPNRQHILRAGNLNPQVRERPTSSRRVLIQCQIDSRVRDIELRIRPLNLDRLYAKKAPVERNACFEVMDLQCHMHLQRVVEWIHRSPPIHSFR